MRNKVEDFSRMLSVILVTALITFIITTTVLIKNNGKLFGTKLIRSEGISITSLDEENKTYSFDDLTSILDQFKALIKSEYIGEEIDENDMIQGAIKGYIAGIGDPYTVYFTPKEMKSFMEESNGNYVGIGVYLQLDEKANRIRVIGVMKDSPAEEVGIKAEDYIVKVNDVEYSGDKMDEAITIMKGKEGEKVKVTVLRGEELIDFDIERRSIEIQHVASKRLNNFDNIGYIAVDEFDSVTLTQFKDKIEELTKDNGIDGLIIDLRSNGGGILAQATDMADLFIEKGKTIVITKDKNKEEELTIAETDPIYSMPVVILVNEYSASAAEVLTGALKESYGAKVVGMKTYGKGVIQTLYSLTDGSGIKVTTAEYFTPEHNKINKIGITPDYEVDLTQDSEGNYELGEEKDAQLLKAIEVMNEEIDKQK